MSDESGTVLMEGRAVNRVDSDILSLVPRPLMYSSQLKPTFVILVARSEVIRFRFCSC